MLKFLKNLFKPSNIVNTEDCIIVRAGREALRAKLITYKSGLKIVQYYGDVYVLNEDRTINMNGTNLTITVLK